MQRFSFTFTIFLGRVCRAHVNMLLVFFLRQKRTQHEGGAEANNNRNQHKPTNTQTKSQTSASENCMHTFGEQQRE